MEVTIHGIVESGTGKGSHFTALDWVRNRIAESLGFEPYPGTLNVRASSKEDRDSIWKLRLQPGIEVKSTSPEFCAARCYKALIGGIGVAVVIPNVPNYPMDMLEIIGPLNLREKLWLKDGSIVTVSVQG